MLRRSRSTGSSGPGALLVALLLLGGTLATTSATSPSAAQLADTSELDAEQSAIRQHQAAVASELDVLHATSAEVGAALATIDANLSAQAAETAQASAVADAARAAETAAAAEVARQQAEVERIQDQLRGMAVNLYVRPPTDDTVYAIVRNSPNQAHISLSLARFRVEDVTNLLQAAEVARDRLAEAEAAARAARQAAEAAAQQSQAKLAALETARTQQQSFALQVSDRIDHLLGEAAVLASQDAELSAQILQRELELAAQLQASMAAGDATVLVVPVSPPPTEATTPPPTVPAPVDATTPAPAPDSAPGPVTEETAPPSTAPPPTSTTAPPTRTIVVTPVETEWVRGIEVAAWLAPNVEAMLAAAEGDGLILTGSGYRNVLDQIAIRREVCGPTDYDIFDKPSWECSPPVARPGSSNHEKGVAIDFSDNGDLIRTREHVAFKWLEAHAAAYGFKNLPSEPWHWSVDGR
jgi:hypothetical protein